MAIAAPRPISSSAKNVFKIKINKRHHQPVVGSRATGGECVCSLKRKYRLTAIQQCLAPTLSRSLATEATASSTLQANGTSLSGAATTHGAARRDPPALPGVLATVYSFPTMEPVRFATYAANQLGLPLRRDILHRAVIYEGDNTRQGTASTKWRSEVRGSGRKIRPQKGQGMARLGDRKSPMLRGGGVAHGPHPRDFGTELPRKIYDLAYRTALSYRYRRGELLVLDDHIDLDDLRVRWLRQILRANNMGQDGGGSLFVVDRGESEFARAMEQVGRDGLARSEDKVDVKNLLERARVVVQQRVLDRMLDSHSSDIIRSVPKAVYYD